MDIKKLYKKDIFTIFIYKEDRLESDFNFLLTRVA